MEKQRELRERRIRQVRKQSKAVANEIRSRVQNKKVQHLNSLKEDVRQGLQEEKENELLGLEKLYHRNLQNVGNGYKEAQCRQDTRPDYEQDKKMKMLATARGERALAVLRSKRAKEREDKSRNLYLRKFALDIEKERASLIASLPVPTDDPVDKVLDKKEVHSVILHDQIKNPTYSYLWAAGLTQKANVHEGDNARTDALIEMTKSEELAEGKSKLEKERIAKRENRFKSALKKERLIRDYACTLEELKDVSRKEQLHKKWNVHNNIVQMVCPPVKKKILEDKHLEAENAVEGTIKRKVDNLHLFRNEELKLRTKFFSDGKENALQKNTSHEKTQNLPIFSLKCEAYESLPERRTLESLSKKSEALLKNAWKSKDENSHDKGTLKKLFEQIQQLRTSLALHNHLDVNQGIPFTSRQNFCVKSHKSTAKARVICSGKRESYPDSFHKEIFHPKLKSLVEDSAKTEVKFSDDRIPPRQDIIKQPAEHNKELNKLIKTTPENHTELLGNVGSGYHSNDDFSLTSRYASGYLQGQSTEDLNQNINENFTKTHQEELLERAYQCETPALNSNQPSANSKLSSTRHKTSQHKDSFDASKELLKSTKDNSIDVNSTPISPSSISLTLSDYIRRLAPKYFKQLENSDTSNIAEPCLRDSVEELVVHPTTPNPVDQSTNQSCIKKMINDKKQHMEIDACWEYCIEEDNSSFEDTDILSSTPLKVDSSGLEKCHNSVIQKLISVNESLSGMLKHKDFSSGTYNLQPMKTNIYQDEQSESALELPLEKLEGLERKYSKVNKSITVSKLKDDDQFESSLELPPEKLEGLEREYSEVKKSHITVSSLKEDEQFESALKCLTLEKLESEGLEKEYSIINKPPVTVSKLPIGHSWAPHELSTIKEFGSETSNITALTECVQTTEVDISSDSITTDSLNEFHISSSSKLGDSVSYAISSPELQFKNKFDVQTVDICHPASLSVQNLISTHVQNHILSTESSLESFHLLSMTFSSTDSITSEAILSALPLLSDEKSPHKHFYSLSDDKNTEPFDVTAIDAAESFHFLTPVALSRISSEEGILDEPDLTLIGSELSIDYLETSHTDGEKISSDLNR